MIGQTTHTHTYLCVYIPKNERKRKTWLAIDLISCYTYSTDVCVCIHNGGSNRRWLSKV